MTIRWTKIILLLIIFFDAIVFAFYGTAKIIGLQFSHPPFSADTLAKDLTAGQVMWYFHGIDKYYLKLTGLAQIIAAVLIIPKRTRLLGSLFYLFGATNILAINIIFDISRGTLILSVILFLNILIIIYTERQKLKTLISSQQTR